MSAESPAQPERIELRAALARLQNEQKRRGDGLSVKALARRLGVSEQSVYNWLSCESLPEADRFDELIQLLGADVKEHGSLNTLYDRAYSRARPKEPVIVVGSIPAEAACFQQRDAMTRLRSTGRGNGLQWVICGLGGVGKTQIAAAFARKLIKKRSTNVLVWASASSRSAIVSTYAQAARVLKLPGCDGSADDAALAFRSWLENADRQWTVVFDDVTEAVAVRNWWPPVSTSGRVLVTTRHRDDTLLARRTVIDLDVYNSEEARDYLGQRLPDTLADDISGVVDDLDRHPLALSHAAAYMIDRFRACSGYRQAFSDRKRRLAELFPEEQELFDGPSLTVATTWSLSIDQANSLSPRGVAEPVLQLASLLDPIGVPLSVFTTSAALRYLASHRDESADPAELTPEAALAGLSNLRRLSLISLDAETQRTHSLVQRAVRDTLADSLADEAAGSAADALLEVWPDIERDTAVAGMLRANSNELYRNRGIALTTGGVHPVLFHATASLVAVGQHRDATTILEGLLVRAQAELGSDHLDVLDLRNSLASVFGEAGDPTHAIALLEQLVVDVRRVLGPDHPRTLATRHNLTYWLGQAGRPADAARNAARLLVDQTRVLGPDNPETLNTRSLIARWRGTAGDLVGAIAATDELLPDLIRVLGSDDPHTLTTRNDLATWYGESGDAPAAVAAFEQLLADRVRALTANHPHTLTTRNNLAYWRGHSGDAAGAVHDYRELLTDISRVLGPDHPHTLATRGNLARWLADAGDLDTALTTGEELLADQRRLLDHDHPWILVTRHNIATWRGQAGDAAAAVSALEHVVADRERVHGPDHPNTLHSRSALAHWRGEAGDPLAAARELRDVLDEQLKTLAPEHPNTLTTRHHLAISRGQTGEPHQATADLRDLLPDLTRILGPDHPLTARTLADIEFWSAQ